MGLWGSQKSGGGLPGSADLGSLPPAGTTAPDQFLIRQNGTWAHADLAQMRGWLGAIPAGGAIRQELFAADGADYTLAATPLGDVAIISLNGLVQHDYSVSGRVVSLSEPALAGDEVQITYWA